MPAREKNPVPSGTVERLVVYKRLLDAPREHEKPFLFSHEIAALAHNSAAQVRRDLMLIGFSGSTGKGYPVRDLRRRIEAVFSRKSDQQAALVGLGNLGRAIVAHLQGRDDGPRVTEVFDRDARKIGTSYGGCTCRDVRDLTTVVGRKRIALGIITVPAAAAQSMADLLIISGVQGLLNFAPCPLKAPARVFVEQVDIAAKLNKVAFFCD